MYKVFIDNSPVIFTQNFLKSSLIGLFRTVSPSELEEKGIYRLRSEIPGYLTVVVHSASPLDAMSEAFKGHELIEAAGGIVKRKKRFLLIKRLGVWDLPKGKIDKGETTEKAAAREIEEECGISGLKLRKSIAETWHTYEFKGKKVLKRTHWFSFVYSGSETLKPQVEEDITEIRWMRKSQVRKALKHTYPSIVDVFESYGKIPLSR